MEFRHLNGEEGERVAVKYEFGEGLTIDDLTGERL